MPLSDNGIIVCDVCNEDIYPSAWDVDHGKWFCEGKHVANCMKGQRCGSAGSLRRRSGCA